MKKGREKRCKLHRKRDQNSFKDEKNCMDRDAPVSVRGAVGAGDHRREFSEGRKRTDGAFRGAERALLRAICRCAEPGGKRQPDGSLQRSFPAVSSRHGGLECAIRSDPQRPATVFCDAARLSKDTLRIVWKRLPKELRGSLYGRAMALHGRAKELRPGGKMYNLRAWDAQGRPFRLRQWRGTPVLLLYGGLGCMGASGREYLDALYAKTSREELRIVVFWPVSSPDELAALAEEFPSGYLQVSDFKGDTTPVKIRCQAQATPTCFLLDSRGRLVFKTIGLYPGKVEEYLSAKDR